MAKNGQNLLEFLRDQQGVLEVDLVSADQYKANSVGKQGRRIYRDDLNVLVYEDESLEDGRGCTVFCYKLNHQQQHLRVKILKSFEFAKIVELSKFIAAAFIKINQTNI